MDWNRVEGNWKQMKGKVKEQWGKLTDDDLDVINGRRDQLEGKIQERYGIAKDQVQKDIDKGDHRLLPYRLAASARIGYGSLNLFAEYALTPLFQDKVMPELTPLNVGLTIIGFN